MAAGRPPRERGPPSHPARGASLEEKARRSGIPPGLWSVWSTASPPSSRCLNPFKNGLSWPAEGCPVHCAERLCSEKTRRRWGNSALPPALAFPLKTPAIFLSGDFGSFPCLQRLPCWETGGGVGGGVSLARQAWQGSQGAEAEGDGATTIGAWETSQGCPSAALLLAGANGGHGRLRHLQ